MSCFLTQHIKHTEEYNTGGIASIYLLDIRDFVSYRFKDDKLYDSCFVEAIVTTAERYELDSIAECHFNETQSNGIYKQELATFVRSIDGEKLSTLLTAAQNRYLVLFRNNQGRAFTFGSDGGASFSFSQQTGQQTEAEGYNITLAKNSIYPLFEVKLSEIDKSPLWILENQHWNDSGIWTRNGEWG